MNGGTLCVDVDVIRLPDPSAQAYFYSRWSETSTASWHLWAIASQSTPIEIRPSFFGQFRSQNRPH